MQQTRCSNAAGSTPTRITSQARATRGEIERRTDSAAASPWEHLGREDAERLARLIASLTDAVRGADIIPFPNPIGLSRPKRH